MDEDHRGPVARRLIADRVAAEAHPRALTTWTPAGGVRVHARLLRPAALLAGRDLGHDAPHAVARAISAFVDGKAHPGRIAGAGAFGPG